MKIGLLLAAVAAYAHPMGNFSVNHYARFDVRPGGIELTYVLDLAEIPTFEMAQRLGVEGLDREALRKRVAADARRWLSGLSVMAEGRRVELEYRGAEVRVLDGAGGLPVVRIALRALMAAPPGTIEYEDRNYEARSGWKEIVVAAHGGARLAESGHGDVDRSRALEAYPADADTAPPQDVRTSFRWSGPKTVSRGIPSRKEPMGTAAPPAVADVPLQAPPARPAAAGTVVRGDYLSTMLRGGEIKPGMLLMGLLVAFGLGAMHALSPGHGKTLVAAYLVGNRGTIKHAMALGGIVTFTHTISVFGLGLGVLYFQKYVVPEKVIPVLAAISGLSIVTLGLSMLYRRARALALASAGHWHGHHRHTHHHHDHDHVHHHHDDGHAHMPEGPITAASLIALGVGGGLTPCPSALVLLLSAIALGRPGLGLLLLTSFSTGLVLVLMAIGTLVLCARHLLPGGTRWAMPALRYAPVVSAVVVIAIGLVMTGVSMGWVRPGRFPG